MRIATLILIVSIGCTLACECGVQPPPHSEHTGPGNIYYGGWWEVKFTNSSGFTKIMDTCNAQSYFHKGDTLIMNVVYTAYANCYRIDGVQK